MDGVVFSKRCDGRTRTVETLAEEWKRDHDEAIFAWDVQHFVAECLDHQDFLRRAWEDSLQCAVDGHIRDLDGHGRMLLGVFDRSITVFGLGQKLIEAAHRMKHRIDGESEFSRGLVETRKIRHRIKKRWPLHDHESMAAALGDVADGRSRTVDDVIDDLRSRNT